MARSTPQRISNINGIGLTTAQKYVALAREHMRLKNLNDFSELQKPIDAVSEIQESFEEESELQQADYRDKGF